MWLVVKAMDYLDEVTRESVLKKIEESQGQSLGVYKPEKNLMSVVSWKPKGNG